MFDLSIVSNVLNDGIQLIMISLLITVGLMQVCHVKALGFEFKRTAIVIGLLVDLMVRQGTTVIAMMIIVLAGMVATRLWIHRHRLEVFKPLFRRIRSHRTPKTTRKHSTGRSRRRAEA